MRQRRRATCSPPLVPPTRRVLAGELRRAGACRAEAARIIDHTATWERLEDAVEANGQTAERLERFCATKRITLAGSPSLAHALRFGAAASSSRSRAERCRPDDGHQVPAARQLHTRSYAEAPSTWVRPIVVGNRYSLDWLVAEGETDAARLFDLVGDVAAVLVLPAGPAPSSASGPRSSPAAPASGSATTPTRTATSARRKPRRSLAVRRCGCAHRVEGGDWCDWDGGRDEFLELVGAPSARRATSSRRSPTSSSTRTRKPSRCSATRCDPPRARLPAAWSTAPTAARNRRGRSTASRTWAPAPSGSASRYRGRYAICIIENEGPPSLFQQKLAAKIATWEGPEFAHNLFVFQGPWGEFTFAEPEARAALVAFCEEHADRPRHREPDARPRRRRIRPTRRDATVRRLARRVWAQERARVLAPASREQGRPDQR